MFKSYLKFAFRSMKQQKLHTFLNIFGLTIGVAAAILIFSIVLNEWKYDRFHYNHNRIFRIVAGKIGEPGTFAGTQAPLGPALKTAIPEIEEFLRLDINEYLVRVDQKSLYERKILCADPAFFQFFSFPILKGDAGTFLSRPDAVVISETTAKKYFGHHDPIGQTMILSARNEHEYQVTGVFADVPQNSSLQFDIVIPFETVNQSSLRNWNRYNFSTYILAAPNTNPNLLQEKIQTLVVEEDRRLKRTLGRMNLQPLSRIHFQYIRGNYEPIYELKFIYILSSVAIFILLLACINYVNLTTALAPTRAREVGIKKVIGSSRGRLRFQFLIESYLHVILAVFCAILLLELALPFISRMLEKEMTINYFGTPILAALAGIIIIIGFLSGSYPAFLMSFYKPIRILQGRFLGKKKSVFRNTLVIFQFSVSIFLIIGTFISLKQFGLLRNKDIGLDKELIVNVPLYSSQIRNKGQELKNEFLKHPNVLKASVNNFRPGRDNWHQSVYWEGQTEQEKTSMYIYAVDKDFFTTFNISIIEGQETLQNHQTGDQHGWVLNEAALKQIGWEHAVGKHFSTYRKAEDIVAGVVKDFNFRTLHHQIEPCVMVITDQGRHISAKITGNDIPATLEYLKKTLKTFAPQAPFDYYFVDDVYHQLYNFERTSSKAILFFTILSVLISSLGLLGLASFMVLQRTKEVGIRKVLGASISQILGLLSKEFAILVLVANLFAWPAAWFAMNKWLENFAYRIEMSWWMFALAGGLALAIALLTVSWQAVRAATANPVEALRYE